MGFVRRRWYEDRLSKILSFTAASVRSRFKLDPGENVRSFISTSEVGSFCLGPFRSKKEKKVSMMMTRTKIKSWAFRIRFCSRGFIDENSFVLVLRVPRKFDENR